MGRLDKELGGKDSRRQGRSQAATLGRFYDGSNAASAELSPVSAGAEVSGRSARAAGLQRSLDSVKELKVGTLNALHLMTHPAQHRWDRDKRQNVLVKPAEPKSEEHRRQIAAVFKDNDLDVMVLSEVESPESLRDFNEKYLDGAYRAFILPGNDPFGITNAFLVKKDLPIEVEARSFKDERYFDEAQGRDRRVFTRDLPALVVRPAGDPRPLFIVMGTHMKSKRMNTDRQQNDNMDIRKVQADRTADIIGRFQAEFGAEVPIMLAGDFNGEPTDETFRDFFRQTGFVDGFDALPKKPSLEERMTHLWFPMEGGVVQRQLDAVFVSKSLRALVKDIRTGRYKDASGKPLRVPSTYQERESDPSDHYPVLMTLDFQPVVRMQREARAQPRSARGDERAGRDARQGAAERPARRTPKTLLRYRKDFVPPETPVSSLMTPEGDVYLFRVIDQAYRPGFVGGFAGEEGAVSYSLNPYIAVQWDSPHARTSESTVLVARNSVLSGGLGYPTGNDHVGSRASGRLSPGTRLEDIRYLNEVKVPIGRENVLLAVPLVEFQKAAAGFGDKPFSVEELLARLPAQVR